MSFIFNTSFGFYSNGILSVKYWKTIQHFLVISVLSNYFKKLERFLFCMNPTLKATSMCIKMAQLPCCVHTYIVYSSNGGNGRCCTRCDLWDHSSQARKSADEGSTLDLKPIRKDTRSPKSVAPQNGPWSNKKSILKLQKKAV